VNYQSLILYPLSLLSLIPILYQHKTNAVQTPIAYSLELNRRISMNLNQYTEKAQEAFILAQRAAQEYGQQTIEPKMAGLHRLFCGRQM
jgi:hypothetical protein